jgi:hypothetical protein
MQAAIKELQDAMLGMAHIEKSQSEQFRIESEKFASGPSKTLPKSPTSSTA